jgi:hypothetical protein
MTRENGRGILNESVGRCEFANIELQALSQQWDRHIRNILGDVAKRKWPDRRLFGLIPIHSYRLRRVSHPGMSVWWIEHDLPPYDLFRCEAYRITLDLNLDCQPSMQVEYQSGSYSIEPLTPRKFLEKVQKLEELPPLIIPRKMGIVTDP